jgi:hypothetical protein
MITLFVVPIRPVWLRRLTESIPGVLHLQIRALFLKFNKLLFGFYASNSWVQQATYILLRLWVFKWPLSCPRVLPFVDPFAPPPLLRRGIVPPP